MCKKEKTATLDEHGNVVRPEEFNQVMVMPGTTLGEDEPEEFEEHFKENADTEVKFLEQFDINGKAAILFAIRVKDVLPLLIMSSGRVVPIEKALDGLDKQNAMFMPERVRKYSRKG